MIEPPARTDDDPPSPCTKVCSIDRRSGWCLGCYRSGDEIGAWPTMPAGEKHALLARLPARRQSMATAGKR